MGIPSGGGSDMESIANTQTNAPKLSRQSQESFRHGHYKGTARQIRSNPLSLNCLGVALHLQLQNI